MWRGATQTTVLPLLEFGMGLLLAKRIAATPLSQKQIV